MTADELLDRLRSAGLTVRLRRARLRVEPRSALAPDDLANLAEHRDALVEILRDENRALPPDPTVPTSPARECECGRPARYGGLTCIECAPPNRATTPTYCTVPGCALTADTGGRCWRHVERDEQAERLRQAAAEPF